VPPPRVTALAGQPTHSAGVALCPLLPQVELGVLSEQEAEECVSVEFNPGGWVRVH